MAAIAVLMAAGIVVTELSYRDHMNVLVDIFGWRILEILWSHGRFLLAVLFLLFLQQLLCIILAGVRLKRTRVTTLLLGVLYWPSVHDPGEGVDVEKETVAPGPGAPDGDDEGREPPSATSIPLEDDTAAPAPEAYAPLEEDREPETPVNPGASIFPYAKRGSRYPVGRLSMDPRTKRVFLRLSIAVAILLLLILFISALMRGWDSLYGWPLLVLLCVLVLARVVLPILRHSLREYARQNRDKAKNPLLRFLYWDVYDYWELRGYYDEEAAESPPDTPVPDDESVRPPNETPPSLEDGAAAPAPEAYAPIEEDREPEAPGTPAACIFPCPKCGCENIVVEERGPGPASAEDSLFLGRLKVLARRAGSKWGLHFCPNCGHRW